LHLGPCHSLTIARSRVLIHFFSSLEQCTESTDHHADEIHATGTLNTVLFSDCSSDSGEGDDVSNGDQKTATAFTTTFSNLLSCLTKDYAWAEICHDAQLAVAEAAT